MQNETSDPHQLSARTKSKEVSEYLRGWKGRDYEVGRLQRQKFLLEMKIQSLRDDRKKWLEGTDNAALREEIAQLKDQVANLKKTKTPKPEKILRTKRAACFYCGKLLDDPTRDHFIPESKGGKGGMNIVASCVKCNNRKGDKLPTPEQVKKYLQMWEFFGIEWKKYVGEQND